MIVKRDNFDLIYVIYKEHYDTRRYIDNFNIRPPLVGVGCHHLFLLEARIRPEGKKKQLLILGLLAHCLVHGNGLCCSWSDPH